MGRDKNIMHELSIIIRFSNDMVHIAIPFFVGDTKNWLKSMKPIMDVKENTITWEEFKTSFLINTSQGC